MLYVLRYLECVARLVSRDQSRKAVSSRVL